jgi:hypothetical protein
MEQRGAGMVVMRSRRAGKTAATEAERPAAMRESRDIEWLVNWAIERQRVHASDVRSDAPAGLRSQLGALGMKVDGGGHGPSGRHVVHPDAAII